MNIDTNILKTLSNQIQVHIKSSDIIKYVSSQRCQEGSAYVNQISVTHHINKPKDKIHTITSLDAGRAFDKSSTPFMIKVLDILGIEETYLNIKRQFTPSS